jgi:hypothetical protein
VSLPARTSSRLKGGRSGAAALERMGAVPPSRRLSLEGLRQRPGLEETWAGLSIRGCDQCWLFSKLDSDPRTAENEPFGTRLRAIPSEARRL